MSSIPGYTLEDFVAWQHDLIVDGDGSSNWSLSAVEMMGQQTRRIEVDTARFKKILDLYEPHREDIELKLGEFDEENQSWRQYASDAFSHHDPITDMAQSIVNGWRENLNLARLKQYAPRDVLGRDVVVFYHEDHDGHVAAAVAYSIVTHHGIKSFKAFPVQYNCPIPSIELTNNTVLYIVDFSYSKEILDKMNAQVAKLVVLDHHKSAQKELADLSYAIFDLNHSGASLAWKYFNNDMLGETERGICPLVVTHTTTYDLWRRKKGEEAWHFDAGVGKWIAEQMATNYQKYGIKSHVESEVHVEVRPELMMWVYLLTRDWAVVEIADQGRPIYEYQMKMARDVLNRRRFKVVQLLGFNVAVTLFQSDIKNYIGEVLSNALDEDGKPLCHFVLEYHVMLNGKVKYSLRSSEELNPDIDVGAIASNFGGGGHEAAASFTSDLQWFGELVAREDVRKKPVENLQAS